MKAWAKGCLAVAGAAVVLSGIAMLAVGPAAVRQGRRFALPVLSIVGEARRFEKFVDSHPFQAPATDTITAAQLDRFLGVRSRLDALYARLGPQIVNLPQGHAESVDEAADAVGVIGDLVPEQMKAYLELEMTPKEYRYLESLVYGKWKKALDEQGATPAGRDLAICELEAAAAAEPVPEAADRLRARAGALRDLPAPPPPGVSQEIHDLQLPRLADIERYSLEAYRHLDLPRL